MDHRPLKRLLSAATVACLAATGWAAWWATGEISGPVVRSGLAQTASRDAAAPRESEPPIAPELLRRPLAAPLYPPPRVTAAVRKPTPSVVVDDPKRTARLDLTLVGTMRDGRRDLAIVSDSAGEVDVKGVGESLALSPAGVRIEEIDSRSITLRHEGRTKTIAMAGEPSITTSVGEVPQTGSPDAAGPGDEIFEADFFDREFENDGFDPLGRGF